jgi:hypothetical protein
MCNSDLAECSVTKKPPAGNPIECDSTMFSAS